jgi:type II secretory pathway pseudopilin PulG
MKFSTIPTVPTEPSGSGAALYPAGIDQVAISWVPAEAVREREAVYDAHEEVRLTAGKDALERVSEIQVRLRRGELSTLTLDLPPGLDVLKIDTGPSAVPAAWRFAGPEQGKAIEITFARPADRDVLLTVTGEQVVSDRQAVSGPIIVRGAMRQDGRFYVAGAPDLRVVEGASSGFRRLSMPDLPEGTTALARLGFEYLKLPASLTLKMLDVEPKVTVETASHVTLQAGVVELDWRASYVIEDRAVERLRIGLAPELIPLNVTGEGIESWQADSETLEVRFKRPVLGPCSIRIQALQNVRKINGTLIPILRCLDAPRESGTIGVSAADEVFLQHYRSEKFRQVTPDRLPDWLRRENPKLAYAYDEPGGELAVSSNLIQPELRVTAYAVARVKEDSVQEEYIFLCDIKKQPIFRLFLALPEGLIPTNLVGDAVQDWEYHAGQSAVTVLLKQAMTGSTSVRLYGERRFAPDIRELPLGGAAIRGVEETMGWFGVAMDANFDLRPVRAPGLTARDVRDAPPLLAAYPNLRLAYQYSGESWGLACATTEIDPRIEGRTRTALIFGRGLVRVRSEIIWNISRATVRTLHVQLPAGSRNASITGRGLLRTDRSGDTLELLLNNPLDGEYPATLTYEMLTDAEGRIDFAEARLPEAERQTGLVGVYTAYSDIETNIREARGLTRAAESPLADGARAMIASYTYSDPDCRLSIEGKGHALAEGVRLRADRSSLDTVVKSDGEAVTYMQCRLRNDGEQYFQMTLPENSTLWAVYVEGKPVRPNRLAKGEILVPLAEAARGAPFDLGVIWAEPTQQLGMAGSFALTSPRLSLPGQEVLWNLHLPAEYQLVDASGNMDLLDRPGWRTESLPGKARGLIRPVLRKSWKVFIIGLWIVGLLIAAFMGMHLLRWVRRINERHRAARRAAGKNERAATSWLEWLVVLFIILILAGMLLPSLSRAREESRTKSCSNNLSQIGKAIFTFTESHNDEFPATLMDLYPTYLDSLNVFQCPSTEREPGRIDYVYVKPDASAPSNTPVAWDKPGNHEGGRNVLCVDGHVRWEQVEQQEVKASVSYQYPQYISGGKLFREEIGAGEYARPIEPQAAPSLNVPVPSVSQEIPAEALLQAGKEGQWTADTDAFITRDVQLGESYLRQGEYEEAERAFNLALKADAANKEARAGIERLNAMKGLRLREKLEWQTASAPARPKPESRAYGIGSIMGLTDQLRNTLSEDEVRRLAGTPEQSAIIDMILSDKKSAELPDNARLELKDTELAITGTEKQIEGTEQAAADLRAALIQKGRDLSEQAHQREAQIAARRRAEFEQRAAAEALGGAKIGTLSGNRGAGTMPLEIRFPSFGTRPYPFRMEYAGMTQARVRVRCIRSGAALVIQGTLGLIAFALLAAFGCRAPRAAFILSVILITACAYLIRTDAGAATPYLIMAILGALFAAPIWLVRWFIVHRRAKRLLPKEV